MGYRWGTGGGSGLHAMGVKVGNHPHPTGWDRACRDGIGPVGMGSGLSGWDRACRDGIGPVRMGSGLSGWDRACQDGIAPAHSAAGLSPTSG